MSQNDNSSCDFLMQKCIFFFKTSLLIYDLQSKNTYYMLKGFLKARRPPNVPNEIKCTNEKMTEIPRI